MIFFFIFIYPSIHSFICTFIFTWLPSFGCWVCIIIVLIRVVLIHQHQQHRHHLSRLILYGLCQCSYIASFESDVDLYNIIYSHFCLQINDSNNVNSDGKTTMLKLSKKNWKRNVYTIKVQCNAHTISRLCSTPSSIVNWRGKFIFIKLPSFILLPTTFHSIRNDKVAKFYSLFFYIHTFIQKLNWSISTCNKHW